MQGIHIPLSGRHHLSKNQSGIIVAESRVLDVMSAKSFGSGVFRFSRGTISILHSRAILISRLTPGPFGALLVQMTNMNLLAFIAAGIFLPQIRLPVLTSAGAM